MFIGFYIGIDEPEIDSSRGPLLGQCHTMLQQIMSHLGLPYVPDHRDEPAAAAASLDMLATAAAASDPPPPRD